jgi:Leucine rich repeat
MSNSRVSFTFVVFIGAVHSIVLNCKFENVVWGAYTGPQYTCVLLNEISVQHGDKVTGITGQHQSGKSNADVKGFYSEGKIVNFIPQNIEKFFPNIIALTCGNGNITEVNEEDFKPFLNLRVLGLWDNKIEVLEEHLFRGNPVLGEISFSNNKLRHISVNTFSILKPLTYLYLDHNPCISANAVTQATVPALINDARRQCFSIETDPKFETCQHDNSQLVEENGNLKKANEILMNAKANLEKTNELLESKLSEVNQKLKTCECDNRMQEVLATNEKRFVEIEKRMIELGSSPCACQW